MDVSRLLAVVTDIESEVGGGLSDALKSLIQLYTTARDAPSTDNSPAIQEALSDLSELVGESHLLQYPPSPTYS